MAHQCTALHPAGRRASRPPLMRAAEVAVERDALPKREHTALYATLNVQPSASEAEIRRAYKDLSRTFHPDKFTADDHVAPDVTHAANLHFQQIAYAYEVLTSPTKRAVYDEFGEEGLGKFTGLSTHFATPSDVQRLLGVERALEQHKQLQQELCISKSKLALTLDASAVIDAYGLENRPWLPQINAMRATHTYSAKIAPKAEAFADCSFTTSQGSGNGQVAGGFSFGDSHSRNHATAAVGVGSDCFVACSVSHAIQPSMLVQLAMQIPVTGEVGTLQMLLPRLQATANWWTQDQRHAATCSAFLGSQLGAVCTLRSLLRPHSTLQTTLRVFALGSFVEWEARLVHAISDRSSLRARLSCGSVGWAASCSVFRLLRQSLRIGIGVEIGSVHGVLLKPTLSSDATGISVTVPVFLAHFAETAAAAVAIAISTLAVGLMHAASTPLCRRFFRRYFGRRHRDLDAAACTGSTSQMLLHVGRRKAARQRAFNGLIVEQALYGPIAAVSAIVSPLPADVDAEALAARSIADVTSQLNALLATDGTLCIAVRPLHALVGVCDPAPGECKALRIAYTHRGDSFELLVDDDDGDKSNDKEVKTPLVELPSPCAIPIFRPQPAFCRSSNGVPM